MNELLEVGVAGAVVAGWRLFGAHGPRLGATGPHRRPVSILPRGSSDRGRRWRHRPGTGGAHRTGELDPARWATRRDLRALIVDGSSPGRLTLGTARHRTLAAERGHSVLVVGPTQSRKTSGFAIPAILEWQGPVVAASVKSDLARHTLQWRQSQGEVWLYDPAGSTGLVTASWSPLQASATWEGARRTAGALTEVARSSPGALADGDFWYATAAKLLAPLLLAAAVSGRSMSDVVRWVDTQEVDEVFDALTAASEHSALQAVHAAWGRDDRQRSAVYTTAETVVEVFADPAVAASETGPDGSALARRIDPTRLVDGSDTLYLCAPAHDQRRLRPLFATLVAQVVEAAYERAGRQGAPLDPPLLVVLDEAANVAPLAELDVLASTAAGHGVQLVTVWQDLAQLQARYGPKAGSVVNNHRVKVFLSGIADPATLEHASSLIGETELRTWATTVDQFGAMSRTDSPTVRRLAPADALRRVPPGDAVVVSGHLPPIRLRLRPWQNSSFLRARSEFDAAVADAPTRRRADAGSRGAVCAAMVGAPLGRYGEVMTSPERAAGADPRIAEFVAQRTAQFSEAARAVRDEAAAAGTLVWDPYDPAWVNDPYSVYAELRRSNPVHRNALGFWVFARHADCLAILRDRRSSSDGRNVDEAVFREVGPADLPRRDGPEAMLAEMAPFLFRDPPDHTRLRGLVQKAFTPKVVDGLRPRLEEICNGLLDEVLERGDVDLVADYAYPLPVQIIVEMLGVPAEDHEQFRVWSHALARGLDPDFLLPPEAVQQRLGAILSFVQYFASLIEERRLRPGDDLLTRLIQAEEQGDVLTQAELLSTCILLLVAGHETTVNLISGGALTLMEHPEQLALVRDDPGVIRSAVEEMLRFVCPVQLTGRVALVDMEVGGAQIAKGQFSMLLIGSANRDPDAFDSPETFDVTRTENNHLGFGFGIHHCLGAPLARLEAQIALPALLRRARRLERSTDELAYKENIVLRGLESLPVHLSA